MAVSKSKPKSKTKREHLSTNVSAVRNPIAKAIERKCLSDWMASHFEMLDKMPNGCDCELMAATLNDVIKPAIKTLEGWDDPDNTMSVMSRGAKALDSMGKSWCASQIDVVKAAVSEAIQITCGMDPVHLAKAVMAIRAGHIPSVQIMLEEVAA